MTIYTIEVIYKNGKLAGKTVTFNSKLIEKILGIAKEYTLKGHQVTITSHEATNFVTTVLNACK